MKTLQEQYNENLIKGLLESLKQRGNLKPRLLRYFEIKKWGVYLFEYAITIDERDNFENPLRKLEKNLFVSVEVRPDGSKIIHESRTESRRCAEDAYDNVSRMIQESFNKGRL